jgi:CheY-like chemotaxis protein
MPNGGKLVVETAETVLGEAYAQQHAGVRPGRYIMIAVSDTGVGMDEHTRAHLFEPFFTTKERGKGTGLGLSTVYGIVKQHGGDIWVYSEPGQGSTFKIYLPELEQPASAEPDPPARERPARLGNETILVVEDEEGLRKLVREVLEQRGYRVLSAGSGEEALNVASRTGRIDLLLTDVVMPNMNGRELARVLGEERPTLPVLYLSGYTDEMVTGTGILTDGAEFLQKPFTAEMLAHKIRDILDRPAAAH